MIDPLAAFGPALLVRYRGYKAGWYGLRPTRITDGVLWAGFAHWGVQATQKYAAAAGVLAAELERGAADATKPSFDALGRSLAAVRHTLSTDIGSVEAGSKHRGADGTTSGRNWISALGIERIAYGLAGLVDHFDNAERASLRRVITDEAEWLVDRYQRGASQGLQAGRWHRDGGCLLTCI